jgi:hypothetical protein
VQQVLPQQRGFVVAGAGFERKGSLVRQGNLPQLGEQEAAIAGGAGPLDCANPATVASWASMANTFPGLWMDVIIR